MDAASVTLPSLVSAHRADIENLVRRHRGRSISLFGSVARGEANAESDIDFLVEFEPTSSLLDLIPVSYTHLDVYKRQTLGRRTLAAGFFVMMSSIWQYL